MGGGGRGGGGREGRDGKELGGVTVVSLAHTPLALRKRKEKKEGKKNPGGEPMS